MIIAVTGSKGFIGSHLVSLLKSLNYEVIEINKDTGYDLTKKETLKNIEEFDCMVHLAGRVSVNESFDFPQEYLHSNFTTTLNALELCRKYNAKMVFASSNLYGTPSYLPIDEKHPVNITSPYTQSKFVCEQLCQFYSNSFGVRSIVLRQFNIYGIGMNEYSLIPTILKQVPDRKIILNDSRPRRDYMHIDDVTRAYLAAINYDVNEFEIFNIASGKSYLVNEIVNFCEAEFQNKLYIIDLGLKRKNEILNIEVNIDKAKTFLRWEPIIDLEKGIKDLLGFYTLNKFSEQKQFIPITLNDQNTYIPLSVPSFKGNEWIYVKDCLDTEWVSSAGKYVDQFEHKISEYTKTKYAVACVNGTSALHISLLLLNVKPEDEVIVPTITFIAPVNAVRYCGAYPVFMDSDNFYNIDTEKAIDFILNQTEIRSIKCNGTESAFSFNKKTGRKISAIIPVHIFGNAVYLDELYKLCKERNIKIIEDATESLGTWYNRGIFKGKHTGTIGDLGCLSFNGNKIITTGGGGMILTDDEKLATRAKYLTTQAKDDDDRFIHNAVGYNYRLTNMLAALGLAQLEQLEKYLKIKKENYNYYKKQIDSIEGLYLAEVPDYADNNHWMYALRIDEISYGKGRDELMTFLHKNKIQTRPVWYLNHLQKEYIKYQAYYIENAQMLLNNTLNIPCSVNLNNDNIDWIIGKLNER